MSAALSGLVAGGISGGFCAEQEQSLEERASRPRAQDGQREERSSRRGAAGAGEEQQERPSPHGQLRNQLPKTPRVIAAVAADFKSSYRPNRETSEVCFSGCAAVKMRVIT